jgi:hypothetical protein
MRIRVWLTVVLLVPLGLLAVANWSRLAQPVVLDMFLFSVRWPLWPFVVALPLLLVVVFLGAALLDRSRQLRQVAALERQLEEARAALDRGREAALDGVAARVEARLADLEAVVEGASSGIEQRLGERLVALDAHVGRAEEAQRTHLEAVSARIASVRDELSADVGEAEDALLRALREHERTVEVEAGQRLSRPALTDGAGRLAAGGGGQGERDLGERGPDDRGPEERPPGGRGDDR